MLLHTGNNLQASLYFSLMVERFANALPLHPRRTVTDFGWSQHPRVHCFVSSVQRSTRFWIQAILHITERNMVKYFCNSTDIRSAWDHVVSAFWQRYPNPFRYCNIFTALSVNVVGVKRQHRLYDIPVFSGLVTKIRARTHNNTSSTASGYE